MFLRIATKRTSQTTYRSLQLCECVGVNGVPRDRVLFSFGRRDQFVPATLLALSDEFAALASQEPALRLLPVAVALLLTNLWVWLPGQTTRITLPGRSE